MRQPPSPTRMNPRRSNGMLLPTRIRFFPSPLTTRMSYGGSGTLRKGRIRCFPLRQEIASLNCGGLLHRGVARMYAIAGTSPRGFAAPRQICAEPCEVDTELDAPLIPFEIGRRHLKVPTRQPVLKGPTFYRWAEFAFQLACARSAENRRSRSLMLFEIPCRV